MFFRTLKSLIIGLASLVLLLCRPMPATAQTITSNIKTCDLLKAVGVPKVEGVKTNGFETEHCFSGGLGRSKFDGITIRAFTDPASASSEGIQSLKKATSTWQDSSGYGEQAIFCPALPAGTKNALGGQAYNDCAWPGQDESLAFRRGCYTVAGGWVLADKALVRGKLLQLDSLLKSTPCPGSEPPAPTLAPAGKLGVSLDCEHEFDDPGLVKCTAHPINAVPGATITYDWTFDGGMQGITGAELQLDDVKPGPHTVVVTAHDIANDQQSEEETVSFIKGAPAAGGGTSKPQGGAPRLGSWGSSAPGAPAGGGVTPSEPGGKTSFDPTTLFAGGTIGIGLLLGGVVIARRRRRKRAPPKTGPEPAPARPPERKPPPSGPEVRTPPPSNAQQTEELVLIAEPSTVIVHGDDTETRTVRIKAFATAGGVSRDVSDEVTISVHAPRDDRYVYLTPGGDAMSFTVKGVHIGTQPHDCVILVDGHSQRTGQFAPPIEIQVRVTPVKIEVRVEADKKGFLHQELVATVPEACSSVSCYVIGIDPVPDADPDDLDLNLDDSAGGNQPVEWARCSTSYRLDGGDWSSEFAYNTDRYGKIQISLPSDIAARLLAGRSADYQVPDPIEFNVNTEVAQSLDTYAREMRSFRKQTSDASKDRTWDSSLVLAEKKCAGYPHEFFTQLCQNPEDDYSRLLGAINLLRGSVIYSYKYRFDFKSQRVELNGVAEQIYGGIAAVLLALPISTGLLRFKPESVRAFVVGVANWCGKGGVLGRLAFRSIMASVSMLEGALQVLMQLIAWFLGTAVARAEALKLSTAYLKALAEDAAGYATLPELEALGRDFQAGFTEELMLMVAYGFAKIVNLAVLFLRAIESCFYGLAHVALLVMEAAIVGACKFFSILMQSLNYEGTVEMWGEFLDSYDPSPYQTDPDPDAAAPTPGMLSNAASKLFDKAAAWLHLNRLSQDRAAGKSLCDTVLDNLWSVADMDQRVGDALTEAYEQTRALNIEDDWLETIRKVNKNETIFMSEWQKSYNRGGGGWGWIGIGEEFDFWLQIVAKVLQAFIFCWATLTELGAKLALAGAEKVFESVIVSEFGFLRNVPSWLKKIEHGMNITSKVDLLADLVDMFMRMALFGIMVFRLYTLYRQGPNRLKELYGLRTA